MGCLRVPFLANFRAGDFYDSIVQELNTLEMGTAESGAELVTRVKILVARLPADPSVVLVKEWGMKALPASTQ